MRGRLPGEIRAARPRVLVRHAGAPPRALTPARRPPTVKARCLACACRHPSPWSKKTPRANWSLRGQTVTSAGTPIGCCASAVRARCASTSGQGSSCWTRPASPRTFARRRSRASGRTPSGSRGPTGTAQAYTRSRCCGLCARATTACERDPAKPNACRQEDLRSPTCDRARLFQPRTSPHRRSRGCAAGGSHPSAAAVPGPRPAGIRRRETQANGLAGAMSARPRAVTVCRVRRVAVGAGPVAAAGEIAEPPVTALRSAAPRLGRPRARARARRGGATTRPPGSETAS